jgi:2-oxoglutarate ferredoxin oxidoreductase subunit delta
MKKQIIFNRQKCKGCGLCAIFCPKNIIEMSKEINDAGYFYAIIADNNKTKCTVCMKCAIMCPDSAIEVWE